MLSNLKLIPALLHRAKCLNLFITIDKKDVFFASEIYLTKLINAAREVPFQKVRQLNFVGTEYQEWNSARISPRIYQAIILMCKNLVTLRFKGHIELLPGELKEYS
jgi:hypothetical protein